MPDEVVICKGKVVSVNAYQRVDEGVYVYDMDFVHSNLSLDPGVFSTDVDVSSQITMSGAVYSIPKILTVRGKLEFGEEYEFVMRPVKKPTVATQASGPRHFKEED